MVFDTLSNCEGCLVRPSEAKPHPTLQQVGDSLGAELYSFRLTG